MGTKFPVHLSGNEEIADEVGGGRQDPGERIDDVNHLDPVVGWKPKYGRQPDEPGGAGAHQRDQHGQNVVPHATQRTDDHIHDGVQTIEQGDPAEAHHTGCHHLGAGRCAGHRTGLCGEHGGQQGAAHVHERYHHHGEPVVQLHRGGFWHLGGHRCAVRLSAGPARGTSQSHRGAALRLSPKKGEYL